MKYVYATAFVLASAISANAFHISVGWSADGENAVVCTLSGVTLLAENEGDCGKIGGTVTHEITATEKN